MPTPIVMAVQKAVLQAAQIAFAASGRPDVGVYENVPHSAAMPLFEIERHDAQVLDAGEIYGLDMQVSAAVWSSYRGTKEAWELLAALYIGLHGRTLPLESGAFVLCSVASQEVRPGEDGLTYKGSITLRVTANVF